MILSDIIWPPKLSDLKRRTLQVILEGNKLTNRSLLSIIPLTHYIEATVEFADSISSPPLAHLADLRPFVEVGVISLHTGQWCHAIISSHCIHKILARKGCKRLKCILDMINQSLLTGFPIQSYPQCHRPHSSSGCVHRSHGTPAVTFNVITLNIVEAGVVIQTSNSIDRTTKSCQGYTPPDKYSPHGNPLDS